MSYFPTEISIQSGSVVELYKFTMTATNDVFAYTTSKTMVNYGGTAFLPDPIKRSSIVISKGSDRDTLTLTFPLVDQFASYISQGQFAGSIDAEVFRLHVEDQDGEVRPYWAGSFVKSEIAKSEIRLHFSSSFSIVSAQSGNRGISLQCRHSMYSDACGVSFTSRRVMLPVTAITGRSVTVSVLDYAGNAQRYFGGIVQFGNEMRMIESSSSNTLVLERAIPSLQVGSSIGVAEGCNKTLQDCGSRFSNQLNFGGFPWASKAKNPYVHVLW